MALAPESLHDELAVLDAGKPLNVAELEQFVARSEGLSPTHSLVELATRMGALDSIRCALCREPSCEGHVMRVHLRANATMEARMELEGLVRDAGLALVDLRGPELSTTIRLGDDVCVAHALEAVAGAPPAYVLLESEDDTALFVQVFADEPGNLAHAEAVSGRHAEGQPLDPGSAARLRLLGWRPPNAACTNYHRLLDVRSGAARLAAARFLARTLREAYGLIDGAPLTMRAYAGGDLEELAVIS
jgi:hypothetical protein